MGRPKHPDGEAGTYRVVKNIHGRNYLYERTRVYEDGKRHWKNTYLGPVAGDEVLRAADKRRSQRTLNFQPDLYTGREEGVCSRCGRIFNLSTASRNLRVMRSLERQRELLVRMFEQHRCKPA